MLSTVPGATLAAAAEEYDAVWRALPSPQLTNGTSPYAGLTSLERAQVLEAHAAVQVPRAVLSCVQISSHSSGIS